MANREQLKIIKQGVKAWNTWRLKPSDVKIDLTKANLSEADLRYANLSEANLSEANLRYANLSEANLRYTNLSEANLRYANLIHANLSGANLSDAILSIARLREANLSDADLSEANLKDADLIRANLSGAILSGAILSKVALSGANFRDAKLRYADLSGVNLSGANLRYADLSETNLSGADLSGAYLIHANLSGANLIHAKLSQANFSNSKTGSTSFEDVDLRSCVGLDTIYHGSPSHISTSTIVKSKGQLPVEFLRGCGLSDWEIESAKLYNPELSNQEISELQYKIYDLRATRSIQVSPLFISYSHADSSFVDELGEKLTEKGIRYWRDIHDLKSGRMETQVDRALRLNPTVLVVLSKNSTHSDWVEHEVNTARELEKELGRDCLCPVALDDSWKSSPWDQRLMRQVMKHNILDFSIWKDKSTFGTTFKKLVDGLQLFYK